MLAKKTAKNQVTIPEALLDRLPPADYFEAEVVGDALILRPVKVVEMVDIDRVRSRLKRGRVGQDEVGQAVRWARNKQ